VLADHVVFEVECIDRMYLNVYVPQLQRALGLIGYLRGLCPIASTAPLAPVTDGFSAAVRRYARACGVPVVDFVKGQRKDDVMHEYLATHVGGEGVSTSDSGEPAWPNSGTPATPTHRFHPDSEPPTATTKPQSTTSPAKPDSPHKLDPNPPPITKLDSTFTTPVAQAL
jgi:hypothetical protein